LTGVIPVIFIDLKPNTKGYIFLNLEAHQIDVSLPVYNSTGNVDDYIVNKEVPITDTININQDNNEIIVRHPLALNSFFTDTSVILITLYILYKANFIRLN